MNLNNIIPLTTAHRWLIPHKVLLVEWREKSYIIVKNQHGGETILQIGSQFPREFAAAMGFPGPFGSSWE